MIQDNKQARRIIRLFGLLVKWAEKTDEGGAAIGGMGRLSRDDEALVEDALLSIL